MTDQHRQACRRHANQSRVIIGLVTLSARLGWVGESGSGYCAQVSAPAMEFSGVQGIVTADGNIRTVIQVNVLHSNVRYSGWSQLQVFTADLDSNVGFAQVQTG